MSHSSEDTKQFQKQLMLFELLHHRNIACKDRDSHRSFNTHLLWVWVRIECACPKTRTLNLKLKIVLLLLLMVMVLLTKGYPISPTVHALSCLISVLKQRTVVECGVFPFLLKVNKQNNQTTPILVLL